MITDPLQRVEILEPMLASEKTRALVIPVSTGYEYWLRGVFRSYYLSTDYAFRKQTDLVVFLLDDAPECKQIAEDWEAHTIQCRPIARLDVWSKSVVYNLAEALPHKSFVAIDVDTLILGGLESLFQRIETAEKPYIRLARDAQHCNSKTRTTTDMSSLWDFWIEFYKGYLDSHDLDMGLYGQYNMCINDGVIACNHAGAMAINETLKGLYSKFPNSVEPFHSRNQLYMNIAFIQLLAQPWLDTGLLEDEYNTQLGAPYMKFTVVGDDVYFLETRKSKILHFPGKKGKALFPELRYRFQKL